MTLRGQVLLQFGYLRLKIGDLLCRASLAAATPRLRDVVLQFLQFVGKLLVLLEGRLEELILLLDFLFQFAGRVCRVSADCSPPRWVRAARRSPRSD